MKKILYILMALFALTACNRNESHITVPDSPDPNTGGATIELDVTEVESIDYTDTHIYGFDLSHKLVYHKYYPTQQELSKETFALGTGAY
ncbi:MAG: membrane lipoprotein lipid attachment site-containing protein, partial [Bacteroides sp.]